MTEPHRRNLNNYVFNDICLRTYDNTDWSRKGQDNGSQYFMVNENIFSEFFGIINQNLKNKHIISESMQLKKAEF